MIQTTQVILASQSEARARLLRAAGVAFESRPARIDEAAISAAAKAEGSTADDAALTLAAMKARRAAAPGRLIIGADQILVCDGQWFDKPGSLDAARAQLQALRGREHTLVTAVVCVQDNRELWRHVARPVLRMRMFSDAFLDAYLALEGEAILGSVGAYRAEGPGIHLFERIDGEYAAIQGLPLLPLLGFLRQNGALTD